MRHRRLKGYYGNSEMLVVVCALEAFAMIQEKI